MNEVKTTIDLPSTFPLSVRVNEGDLPSFIKKTLAVELYREGKLSLGKAAELAGVRNKWEMLTILDKSGISIHYSIEDAKEDLNTLNDIMD